MLTFPQSSLFSPEDLKSFAYYYHVLSSPLQFNGGSYYSYIRGSRTDKGFSDLFNDVMGRPVSMAEAKEIATDELKKAILNKDALAEEIVELLFQGQAAKELVTFAIDNAPELISEKALQNGLGDYVLRDESARYLVQKFQNVNDPASKALQAEKLMEYAGVDTETGKVKLCHYLESYKEALHLLLNGEVPLLDKCNTNHNNILDEYMLEHDIIEHSMFDYDMPAIESDMLSVYVGNMTI